LVSHHWFRGKGMEKKKMKGGGDNRERQVVGELGGKREWRTPQKF